MLIVPMTVPVNVAEMFLSLNEILFQRSTDKFLDFTGLSVL